MGAGSGGGASRGGPGGGATKRGRSWGRTRQGRVVLGEEPAGSWSCAESLSCGKTPCREARSGRKPAFPSPRICSLEHESL